MPKSLLLPLLFLTFLCIAACSDSTTTNGRDGGGPDTGGDTSTIDGDAVDAGGPVLVPTTFTTTAKFRVDVNNLPKRKSDNDPLLEFGAFERLHRMVSSPPRWLQWGMTSNGALDGFQGADAQALDTAMVKATIDALDAQTPITAARRTAAGDDFKMLTADQRLHGTLKIVSAAGADGVLAPEQQYAFTHIAFPWTLPCVDDPTANCDERFKLSLGDLKIPPVEGVFGGTINKDDLAFAPHALSFSVLGFAHAFATRFALPRLMNNPAQLQERALMETVMKALVASYNATSQGQAEPASTTADFCAGVARAWSRLVAAQDSRFNATTLEPAIKTGCADALKFADDQAAFMAAKARDQSKLTVSNLDVCNLRDTDADGVYDEFGEVWDPDSGMPPVPTSGCILQLEFEAIDQSTVALQWEFTGVAQ